MKNIRILHITDLQQQIIKLRVDGDTDEQIMDKLNVNEDDIEHVLFYFNRKTPKLWKKSLNECWIILREWNMASTLILLICLLPVTDNNHNIERVRTPKTNSSRISRKNDVDIFDLF